MGYHERDNINIPCFHLAKIKMRSSYSQRQSTMTRVRTQVVTVVGRALPTNLSRYYRAVEDEWGVDYDTIKMPMIQTNQTVSF